MKRLVTAETVEAEFAQGRTELAAPRGQAIVSPAAWSRARELGVTIQQGEGRVPVEAARAAPKAGGSERTVDPSGVIAVRGRSVRLGEFTGAGPDRHVGLADVVTGRDRSPMTAGFMAWGRADSFPWTLDYDELDYVIEGVLELGIDGRVVEARAGDVLYIPRGSKVVFGTPGRVRVFYVTYPADWAGAAKPG